MIDSNFNWNAAAFFERLTGLNRFAKDNAYRFSRVSSPGSPILNSTTWFISS